MICEASTLTDMIGFRTNKDAGMLGECVNSKKPVIENMEEVNSFFFNFIFANIHVKLKNIILFVYL